VFYRFHGSVQLRWLPSVRALDQLVSRQSLEEVLNIILGKVSADAEFTNDLLNDFWLLRRPAFKKFEDPRAHEIDVEHVALPDIQNDCAILAMRTANAF
jgi:hypothetical protein